MGVQHERGSFLPYLEFLYILLFKSVSLLVHLSYLSSIHFMISLILLFFLSLPPSIKMPLIFLFSLFYSYSFSLHMFIHFLCSALSIFILLFLSLALATFTPLYSLGSSSPPSSLSHYSS